MDFRKLSVNPDWAELWASPQLNAKRTELLRLLRAAPAREAYALGRLHGTLDTLDWLERLPRQAPEIE